jgi:hypothetical protein
MRKKCNERNDRIAREANRKYVENQAKKRGGDIKMAISNDNDGEDTEEFDEVDQEKFEEYVNSE